MPTIRNVTFLFHGLPVRAEIIIGDICGDPSISNGICRMETYVNDYSVLAPDGVNLGNMFRDAVGEDIEKMAIKAATGKEPNK